MIVKVWNIYRKNYKDNTYRKTTCYVVGEGKNWLGAHFTSNDKATLFKESYEHQVKEVN